MLDFPLYPEQASSVAFEVDLLYWAWVVVSVLSALLVAGLVFYFFTRFRRRSENEVGIPEKTSTALEITWSVIPLIIMLGMFVWGTKVYFDLVWVPKNAVEYLVTGKQWMWKVQHPEGVREINDLHVPVGVPIKLTMTSEDVIHSYYIPAFRVKADVFPGRYSTLWFEATKPGVYHIFCAEYCGAEHSKMGGKVYVMEQEDYQAWLAGGTPGQPPAESGAQLFTNLACNTCHEPGDEGRGPWLADRYGEEVTLTTGRTLIADEDYLRESILNPTAKIVAGYTPLMPTYQGQVTEEQLAHLIAYIKSLSDSDGEAVEAATVGQEDGAS